MRNPRITPVAAFREQLPHSGPGDCVHLADAAIRQLPQGGVRLLGGEPLKSHSGP